MEGEQKNLISELSLGKELTEQLRNHLNPASSIETRLFLVEKILSSYEKALSLLNWVPLEPTIDVLESPHFYNNSSPTSDISDQETQKNVFKKRKTQPRWTEQVKVCSGTGVEAGPLDDGYSWRKYGQKDILGANHPRGYYRCTHRHSQGCLAIKQVQRSDEDPSIFEITYRGRHTCVQTSHFAVSRTPLVNQSSKQNQNLREEKLKAKIETVKTEDLDTKEEIFPSFSFLDELVENESVGGSISPTFISPATSESNNYFSASPCQIDGIGVGYNVHTPDSELTDFISAPTSVNNSPVGDLDFSNFDFDTNFQFENFEFFA